MVDGSTLVAQEYWDENTKKMIPVTLTIRDHILFRLLGKIEAALGAKNG